MRMMKNFFNVASVEEGVILLKEKEREEKRHSRVEIVKRNGGKVKYWQRSTRPK